MVLGYRHFPMTTRLAVKTLRGEALSVDVAAKLYRGLGDPTRLRLLLALQDGERRVVDLVAEVGLAQSTVSGHLACLRDCGLLEMRPQGRQSFYRLAHDVRELLAATETLLARTGFSVTLCPNTDGLPQ